MWKILVLALAMTLAALAPAQAQPTGYLPPNVTSCSPTTSSALCIPDTGKFFLQIENTSATADVACAFNDGTAVMNSAGSFIIYAGQRKSWSRTVSTSPPPGPMNCISSSGTATLWISYY